jgi:hypothetical protein
MDLNELQPPSSHDFLTLGSEQYGTTSGLITPSNMLPPAGLLLEDARLLTNAHTKGSGSR